MSRLILLFGDKIKDLLSFPIFEEIEESMPLKILKKVKIAYVGSRGHYCPDFSYKKYIHRRNLLEKFKEVKGDVSLELFAGKGVLSKSVYSKYVNKMILVDKDKELLEKAKKKLGDKAEIYCMNNIKFIKEVMPKLDLSDLRIVDFDAFGNPMRQIREFFKYYKVKKPLIVTLTDGSGMYLTLRGREEGKKYIKKMYGVSCKKWSYQKHKIILLKAMQNIGKKRGFAVVYYNFVRRKKAGQVGQYAYYAGFKIIPIKKLY
jgi:sulfite reductase alpha subunit-like flavoprotein